LQPDDATNNMNVRTEVEISSRLDANPVRETN
jgi:hypothetical protein